MTDASRPVSKRLRFEIFRRDGFRCRYCGLTSDETGLGLTVDHVIPVTLGGTNEPSNLWTACVDCNSGKSSVAPDSTLIENVKADAARFAAAVRVVADARQVELHGHVEHWSTFLEAWGECELGWMADDAEDSIRRLAAKGLTPDDIAYYVRVTDRARGRISGHFKYFCGCCWNEVRGREAEAAASLGLAPSTPSTPVRTVPTDIDDRLRDVGAALAPLALSGEPLRRIMYALDGLLLGFQPIEDGLTDWTAGDPELPWVQLGVDLHRAGLPMIFLVLVSAVVRARLGDHAGTLIETGHEVVTHTFDREDQDETEAVLDYGGHGGVWLELAGTG